jgi:hypothetical protein
MQFNRKALILAAEMAVEGHYKEWEDRKQKVLDDERRGREDWLRMYSDRWRVAVENITAKLDAGEVIMDKDIPNNLDSWSRSATYRTPERGASEYRPPNDLLALIQLLNTVEDDTVSTSGLKSLGVGQSAMSAIAAKLHLAKAALKDTP